MNDISRPDNWTFTDGKPWIVTEEDVHLCWSGGKDGKYFRCSLCGHKIKVGETARFQFTNNIKGAGGNPLVCQSCDGPDIIERWKKLNEEWLSSKFWWFRRHNER